MADKNAPSVAATPAPEVGSGHPAQDSKTLRFEEALEALEATVERLERGELTLDEALDHYAEGTRLVQRCQQTLDAAEARLEALRTEGTTPPSESTRTTVTPPVDEDLPF